MRVAFATTIGAAAPRKSPLSTTHPARKTAERPPRAAPAHRGRLEWRQLLDWLRDDGLIVAADVDRVAKRLSAGDSTLHPLVRLGGAGLVRADEPARQLDTEALTEWLA